MPQTRHSCEDPRPADKKHPRVEPPSGIDWQDKPIALRCNDFRRFPGLPSWSAAGTELSTVGTAPQVFARS
jgi:hypothetical protein